MWRRARSHRKNKGDPMTTKEDVDLAHAKMMDAQSALTRHTMMLDRGGSYSPRPEDKLQTLRLMIAHHEARDNFENTRAQWCAELDALDTHRVFSDLSSDLRDDVAENRSLTEQLVKIRARSAARIARAGVEYAAIVRQRQQDGLPPPCRFPFVLPKEPKLSCPTGVGDALLVLPNEAQIAVETLEKRSGNAPVIRRSTQIEELKKEAMAVAAEIERARLAIEKQKEERQRQAAIEEDRRLKNEAKWRAEHAIQQAAYEENERNLRQLAGV